ncbi:hypothetical protein Tcan_10933 [Toxocara canis]|uniref:Uncharacterized protein n=1 Tax=Toxocara canis TaxID=6265 RepID=A0A0B2VGR4_TOXCA|nr:hypothetical protein Tcan_10933 [Toxocara canis]
MHAPTHIETNTRKRPAAIPHACTHADADTSNGHRHCKKYAHMKACAETRNARHVKTRALAPTDGNRQRHMHESMRRNAGMDESAHTYGGAQEQAEEHRETRGYVCLLEDTPPHMRACSMSRACI